MKVTAAVIAGLLLAILALDTSAQDRSKMKRVGAGRVAGEYIVVLEDSVVPEHVPELARQLANEHSGKVEKTWKDALKGFFVKMPDGRAEALSRHPLVKFVEENAEWYYSGSHQTDINPVTCDPTSGTCSTVTDNRLWHLDRMDQNYAPATNTYSYCTTGSGRTVYVVDSGVNKNHQEFGPSGSRVATGYNASGDLMPANDPCLGFALPASGSFSAIEEGQLRKELLGSGHGTAVAALVGGNRIGVAKSVNIVPVKVSRCAEAAARARDNSYAYVTNDTIFRSQNGFTPGTYYRALNSGTSASSDPGSWPTTVDSTKVDGGVTWKVYDPPSPQTTQMITDGLDWILSSSNSGPKSGAVVTLSTYRLASDTYDSGTISALETAVEALLDSGLTVIASANNQNGDACDTTPSRMSVNNPDSGVASNVITAGGSMILNRTWGVNLTEGPSNTGVEADGFRSPGSPYGVEPSHDATKGVRDGRWICGAGDSSGLCSNGTATSTVAPNAANSTYYNYQGGSNAGPCVTLFAPAKNIFVASVASSSSYRDARERGGHASGTSWSAPIVAGFAARILENNSSYGPTDIRTALLLNSVSTLDTSTLNTYDYNGNPITGTPNKLLHLGDVKVTDQPDSATASGSSTTPLSVTASGTSTLSYQWYEVNSGFDYTTYPRGAAAPQSSTAISGATSSTYNAPSATVAKAYWVRVTNSCASADSDIAVVTPAISAPTSLVASPGSTAGTIALAWNSVTGANAYVVERKAGTGSWTTVTSTVTTTNYTDTGAPGSSAVLYRVRARITGTPNVDSDTSNVDFSHTWALQSLAGVTPIRAIHLTGLRAILNQLTDAGGYARQYTDNEALEATLLAQGVDDSHFTSLMTKINIVRAQYGVVSASFAQQPAATGSILKTQLESLRAGLQ